MRVGLEEVWGCSRLAGEVRSPQMPLGREGGDAERPPRARHLCHAEASRPTRPLTLSLVPPGQALPDAED
jgi:hypothetical protein